MCLFVVIQCYLVRKVMGNEGYGGMVDVCV